MVPSTHLDQLWNIQDVAQYLRMPVSSVYRMTGPKARLKIPHVRIAGRVRFRQKDIDRWLELLTVSNMEVLARVTKASRGKEAHGIPAS